jgi:hypothetical protein
MRRLFVVCMLAGCNEPPPPCIADQHALDLSCAPSYTPTFTNVYNRTLSSTSCGSTRSACHSATGRAGNLSFATIDDAYTQLLDPGTARVKPGDPACSELIVRTSSPGEDYQMPPGDPLSDPAQCALVQWVVQGAER